MRNARVRTLGSDCAVRQAAGAARPARPLRCSLGTSCEPAQLAACRAGFAVIYSPHSRTTPQVSRFFDAAEAAVL
jgi:hypothetical protein